MAEIWKKQNAYQILHCNEYLAREGSVFYTKWEIMQYIMPFDIMQFFMI